MNNNAFDQTEQERMFLLFLENNGLTEIKELATSVLEARQAQKEVEAKKLKYEVIENLILVALCLLSVSLLAYFHVIDGCTTGTLIGAVIGYALSRFQGGGNF